MKTLRHSVDPRAALFDLLGCLAAYEAANWIYAAWLYRPDLAGSPEALVNWPVKGLLSALTAWVALLFVNRRDSDVVRLCADQFFWTFGLNVIVQYGRAYLVYIEPTPWFVLAAGSAFALVFLLVSRKYSRRIEETGPILLAGPGALPSALAARIAPRISGIVTSDCVTDTRGAMVLVNDPHDGIRPRELLELTYAGVPVESAAMVYENVLHRVCSERLRTAEFLFATVNRNRAAVALQSVYTNVIGLALLLAMAPVMAVIAACLTIFGGGGPVLERVECLGFQQIPFSMLRFGVRRRDGSISGIGRALTLLSLVNLPQLINVVRGEMALCGPPPMRKEFAEHLCGLALPFIYRFTTKPGIMGWSQVNIGTSGKPPDELERLEFDLYYVKEQSLSFDADIFVRTILRRPAAYRVSGEPAVEGWS